ncbi:malonyl-CoA synthase [Xinfangfangia sp. CPCC 101601]|uniref:Malonyl-CoA synthase n=1 Tax=Pseudogemmobacter lacusdianii TaxID=3069608 RepID=A0ABU0W0W6_9RHOB|nr:malonyl-CoA synthase [Xinfangfangia sp. CPCC 101601]MDQ2067538.1 malonyl-CoA synthase [Xinfangfangia sp. CPCC 101601]
MANILYDALFAPLAARENTLITTADGGTISGAAFLALVHRQANALRALGLRPGDRLALQVAKSPEALALYGAALAAGVVVLPLNTAYTPAEVAYFLGDCGAAVLVGDAAAAEGLAAVAADHGARFVTLNGDGSGSFSDLVASQSAAFSVVSRGGTDLAALLYTSGTTGRSKGAMLSHDNLLSNAEVLREHWRFTSGDVLLHALPIFHTHGLFVASNVVLSAGASMIFLPGFSLPQVLRFLPQASVMMGVPTFYTRLLDAPEFTRDLVAHMRLFVSGSAPLLAETHIAFEERTGHRILERYGMTETNMNTSNPYEGARRAGTVGPALPGVELRITDPASGEQLPDGTPGMIEVRGPNVFKGYWNMPEKTREELRENGFFITGDIGVIDDQGYVSIVGRAKDLIISGGYNIYPKEIELLLDEAPEVLETAVIGVPHPDFGEAVVAVIVPKPGQSPTESALLAGLQSQLARFKQPKAIILRDELPRNTMGKVQKNLLRAEYAELFRPVAQS